MERFSSAAVEKLFNHGWPGNVRELQHVVERAVVLARTSEVQPDELPRSLTSTPAPEVDFGSNVRPLREMQRRYVAWAHERLGARKLLTAERLGIDDKTLARWLTRGEGERS